MTGRDRIDRPLSPAVRLAELVAAYGPAAFVLCLPLEFTTGFLHQPLSRFVLAIVAAAFIYLFMVKRRTLSLPRNPSAWWLALLVAASLLSWVLTRKPGSTNAVVDVALYPLVGLLVSNLLLTEEDHRRAWVALVLSGLLVAVLGLILYVTNIHIWTPNPAVANRLNITFADPNITARFLTLCACAAVVMYSARQGPRWLVLPAAVTCAVVLPMTWSRSGLVLFIVMVLFAAVIATNHRRAAAIAAVALLAFAISTVANPDTRLRAQDTIETVAVLAPAAPSGATHTASAGQGSASAAQGPASAAQGPASAAQGPSALQDNRRYLIAAGLAMFRDHPLTGVGFGGYQHALLTGYRGFVPPGYTDTVSHTSMVTILAEQGLVGMVLFLAFMIQLAREAFGFRQRKDRWAVWSTLPATLVVPIFFYSQFEARFLQEPYLWLCLGMLYSAQRIGRRSVATGPATETERPQLSRPGSVEVA